MFASILEMRDEVERSGAEFVVSIVPIFAQEEEDWQSYPLRDLHSEIHQVLTAREIQVIDLLASFERDGRPSSELSHHIWHPNPAGSRVIAEALVATVLTRPNREAAFGEP